MFKNVLIPLDGSKLADDKISEILSLLKLAKGAVTLLHVIELYPLLPRDKESEYNLQRDQIKPYLERAKQKIENEGIKINEIVIKIGKPIEEICKYAERKDVDIVIIASHGAGGVMKWALGSVSEKVVRHCSKPVLLLRANGD